MGDWKMVDSMIVDGLWDVYNQYHMGITAENVAKEVRHQPRHAGRAGAGQPAEGRRGAGRRPLQGRDRAVSIPQRKGDPLVFDADEFINKKTSAEALAGLRPPSTRPAA
jgi:acetyl-CoA C-acetyltransferase